MNKPLLTIGMAAYGDFAGVYMTIQALKMYQDVRNCELIVVDNDPSDQDGTDSKAISNLVKHMCDNSFMNVQYIPFDRIRGTTVPRQLIFDHAQGQFVLCMDSHVMLMPNAIAKLKEYIFKNPDSKDILCGPLFNDKFYMLGTHFNYIWRAEMWGRWGQAYRCPKCGRLFSCNDDPPQTTVTFLDLMGQISNSPHNAISVPYCQGCQHIFPKELAWAGHERRLMELGYKPAGAPNSEPFEIPAMGLGLFCCRKDVWHGWGYDHRGFGGEECCIHDIHRKEMGGKTICIPSLGWIHRFAHTKPKYPLNVWNKVRNYILWFKRLQYDLKPLYNEFVPQGKIEPHAFDFIASDPVRHVWPNENTPPGQGFFGGNPGSPSITYNQQLAQAKQEQQVQEQSKQGCGTCGQSYHVQPDMGKEWTVESLYDWLLTVPRDLDKHMPKITEYADKCDHVTDLGHRRESIACFLQSTAHEIVVYSREAGDPIIKKMIELSQDKAVTIQPQRLVEATHMVQEDIDETDLLFIDTTMTYDRILRVLETYSPKVNKYIIIHDTQLHMIKGEDGGPGIMSAVRQWLRANPQWFPVYLTDNQYGLAVYSCLETDRPKLPHMARKVFNFALHAASHVRAGVPATPDEIMEARLNICANCEARNVMTCSACGCPLSGKTSWADQYCDHGKWGPYRNEIDTGLPATYSISPKEVMDA